MQPEAPAAFLPARLESSRAPLGPHRAHVCTARGPAGAVRQLPDGEAHARGEGPSRGRGAEGRGEREAPPSHWRRPGRAEAHVSGRPGAVGPGAQAHTGQGGGGGGTGVKAGEGAPGNGPWSLARCPAAGGGRGPGRAAGFPWRPRLLPGKRSGRGASPPRPQGAGRGGPREGGTRGLRDPRAGPAGQRRWQWCHGR